MVVTLIISDAGRAGGLHKLDSLLLRIFTKNPDLVLVYPTETCYGLGCRFSSKKAVERLYRIKERDKGKPLSTIMSSLEMAEKWCVLDESIKKLVKEFMPGALTLVVKDRAGKMIAFRISGNATARRISEIAGEPIISTSANISGEKEIYSGKEAADVFKGKVDVIVDAGELAEEKPSTVYDAVNKKILREGPVSLEAIEKVLE